MGLLNDVKEATKEVKTKEVDAKAGRKARAKERKEAKAQALGRILDYLKKHNVPELKADVELLSAKPERVAGTDLLTTIFGSAKPAKGTKITALDCFTKFKKGYPEMRKLMKQAKEKGVIIELNMDTQTYEVK